MIIIFLEFFFKIFNAKVFDNVSTVFPDFEIIMKRTFFKFSSFLKFVILFSSRSFEKKYSFLNFCLKKIVYSFCA